MANDDLFWFIASLVVLGVLGVFWLRRYLRRRRAREWPVITGLVEATGIRLQKTGYGQSVHVGEIIYSYHAAGVIHSGSWRRRSIFHGKLQKWIDAYPHGHKLAVRYDPARADQSEIFDDDQARIGAAT